MTILLQTYIYHVMYLSFLIPENYKEHTYSSNLWPMSQCNQWYQRSNGKGQKHKNGITQKTHALCCFPWSPQWNIASLPGIKCIEDIISAELQVNVNFTHLKIFN